MLPTMPICEKTNAPQANFDTWRANFGNTGSGPAAAQPTAILKYDASPKNGVLTGAINNSTTPLVTLPAAPTATGTIGIDMSRGSGLTPAGLTNGYSSSGFTGADLAAAVAANDYHEFGFTLDATHKASLSKLDMTMRRGAADGPTTFEVLASFDNFATAPIVVPFNLSQASFTYLGRADGDALTPDPSLDTPFYYMTNDQPGRPNTTFSSTDPIPTIDLSTIAALQDIPAGTTVKFRMYGWALPRRRERSASASLVRRSLVLFPQSRAWDSVLPYRNRARHYSPEFVPRSSQRAGDAVRNCKID